MCWPRSEQDKGPSAGPRHGPQDAQPSSSSFGNESREDALVPEILWEIKEWEFRDSFLKKIFTLVFSVFSEGGLLL